MRLMAVLAFILLLASALAPLGAADDDAAARKLADDVVKAAGGPDKLLRIFRWKEQWFLGESKDPRPRQAILAPPLVWGQDGRNIAKGNADRSDKTYLVWVWTLAPLLEKDSQLTLLPEIKVEDKPAVGLKLSRKDRKDYSIYFDKESKRPASTGATTRFSLTTGRKWTAGSTQRRPSSATRTASCTSARSSWKWSDSRSFPRGWNPDPPLTSTVP
ncbi:MAG: hypothetical protein K2R98_14535 [Gemmataceae bacterium]|nr:hypothetical protein [Gemmataceae bacterium]